MTSWISSCATREPHGEGRSIRHQTGRARKCSTSTFAVSSTWHDCKCPIGNSICAATNANSFAPLLERAGTRQSPSRVIIVSSTAGTTVPHVGEHGTIMYSISKAAAHHLSRQLAVELGPRNITTNTVAPGFFPSKLANGLIEMLGGQQELEDNNPRKRLGEPEDIAGVMVFLCSPAGAYINGEDIAVDGGMRLASGRHSKL